MSTPTPAADQAWTIGSLLNWTAGFLAQKGCESPRVDAEVLLAFALGCKRIDLYGLRHAEPAGDDVRKRYKELIRRRVEGCPVAYLVGRKEFFSLEFEVGPAVLIPRPDSEVVVLECLALAKPQAAPRVLDIGTGSGNLAVAIAKHHSAARLTAIDISPDAQALAARNAQRHGVAERITFLLGDLFAPLPSGQPFDFIVSNPPYIAEPDLPGLPPGVRDYEPRVALAGGPDGFAVFDRLVAGAPDFLKPGAWLIIEIGSPQEEHARAKITSHGGYDLAPTVRDYSGHPRVVRARRV
jgi:release factor glutamine methyltransferase